MSGFIWQFLSKIGGFRTQRVAQRVLKDREVFRSEKEAWKKVQDEYSRAMFSNDPIVVKQALDLATKNAHLDEKKAMGLKATLSRRLENLQKPPGGRNTPPTL